MSPPNVSANCCGQFSAMQSIAAENPKRARELMSGHIQRVERELEQLD